MTKMYELNSDVYIAEYRNEFEKIKFFVKEYVLTFLLIIFSKIYIWNRGGSFTLTIIDS